ncbi:hypothetical protein [Myceligenerans pegani]|uniref:Uncharacterized protein n=1 Tax=Myceligenerans pegani TaxID=2776917 RepID=A0ABR9N150_9MICO|nr:hypothetical protein [Myceligenerans sp. TRM 65318]MBE1877383.1 hypothetical protein [Myceligenerans sp. TRM 65318]MBE3019654.1 hypothetical protein [Myceligenerans sp. TRM 65318]
MTTQAVVLEPFGTGTRSVRTDTNTATDFRTAARTRARTLWRWAAGFAALAIMTALLVGWVGQARAATTDRLAVLNARIDERVSAGRAMSERLATVIVVARNVQANSAGADPDARAALDAAIRSAEGIVGQRVTTQAPATVPQAEMLVEQATLMADALALTTMDLRTAVDRVRVSRGDLRPEVSYSSAGPEDAGRNDTGIPVAVARP